MEVTQKSISDAMRSERESLVSYLEALPEGAWDKGSSCEGWTIREVVSHLIGNAKDLSDYNLEGAGSEEYNQRQIDERKDRSPAELLAEWAVEGPRFEEQILAQSDDFWNTPYLDLGTVGEALQRLVEDIWVHGTDIRIPLGDEAPRSIGLDATLDSVARYLKTRVSQRSPEVRSITFEGRRVETGEAGTDIVISGDPVTIALAATGRASLDELSVEPSIPPGFAETFNIYAP